MSARTPTSPSPPACWTSGAGTRQAPKCGWTCARASSGTTARRSRPRTWLVAHPRRRPEERQSDPVHLGQPEQLQDRRQRVTATSSSSTRCCSSGWRSSPAMCCRAPTTRRSAPEGFEKKPVGSGPYMVDAYERNAFLRLKANPHYWGGKPAFDTVVFKFVTDASSPRGRDRVRRLRRHAGDPVRGIRPAEEEAGPAGCDHADLRHRHDLHHQRGADAGRERAPGDGARGRQEAARGQAAARLRRADRHAGGAAVRGLRSLDQGRRTTPSSRWNTAGQERASRSTSR